MNKLFAIGLAVYLIGDPGMSLFSAFSISKEVILAFALALVAVPWVASQIDN